MEHWNLELEVRGLYPHKHPLLSLSRTLSAHKSTGKYLEEVLAPLTEKLLTGALNI